MRRPVRRILTSSERASLKAREADFVNQLEAPTIMMGPNGHPIRVADRSNLQFPQLAGGQLKKIRKTIEEGRPADLTRYERTATDKEIRRLEESVRSRMVPEKEFKMPKDDSSGYRKVVDVLVKQAKDPSLSSDINRLKNLRREREPENPNAGNIEDLRRS